MTEPAWNPMAQQFDAPVTLADFLLAQFDREERLARHAESVWQVIRRDPKPYPGVAHHRDDWMKAEAFSLNINPWFILKQVEAKRRIVDWHALVSGADPQGQHVTGCACCIGVEAGQSFTIAGPCLTLRLLALPYAGHSDYRSEWAP